VDGVYTTLLHRAPGPAETTNWVNALNSGTTPAQMVQTVVGSPEFRDTVIRDDYARFLHRAPGASELTTWEGFLQAGNSEDAMAALFLTSTEYFNAHGRDGTWLNSVYQDVLGRGVDPNGVAAWTPILNIQINDVLKPVNTTAATYGRVATGVLQSPESRAREITLAYEDFLGRTPDPSGMASWMAAIDQNPNPEHVLAQIAASPEFVTRASNQAIPPVTTGTITTVTAPVNTGVNPTTTVVPTSVVQPVHPGTTGFPSE
jgi:hypothetical protein